MKLEVRQLLLVFLSSFVGCAGGRTAVSSAPSGESTKLQPPPAWTDIKIKLVHPGASREFGKIDTVSGKEAMYRVLPKPKPGVEGDFQVLVVQDPSSESWHIIAAGCTFYIADESGLLGVAVFPNVVLWTRAYTSVPKSKNAFRALTKKFAAEFDGNSLNRALLDRAHTQVLTREAVPAFFFSQDPVEHSLPEDPVVEAVGFDGGILQLAIMKPSTQQRAVFLINLRERKIMRSVVDGKEMDISGGPGYATPKK